MIINSTKLTTILAVALFIFVGNSCKTEESFSNNDVDIIVTDDDDITPTPADDDDSGVSMVGIVLSAHGQPLSDVVVSVHGSDVTAETDISGRFRLEDLEASDRAVLTFRKDMYARASTPVELREEVENTIIQRMALVDHVFNFGSNEGYVFGDEEALELNFPSNNVVDAQGKVYNGSVVVEVTVYDLVSDADNGNEVLAAPGDFTAINGVGEEKTLESYGMIQINMTTPSGADLQLGTEPATVRLPVQSLGAPPVVGDEIAAWSYNEAIGKWEEEAIGTVSEHAGELVWEFTAPHFSTWNCDRPISTHGCLTGTVTNSQGEPRAGATVRAVGLTYISTTTARTSQDGSFCLEVKNGETVWAEISYSMAGQTATQRTDPVTVSPGQASCSLGESTCDDLGTIPVDIQTCLSGVVIDATNVPYEGKQVMSPTGGVATSDVNGSFCMTTPVFQSSDVFVTAEVDEIGFRPVRVYTQPGLPSCQAGCPNVVVLRPYEATTCANGAVFVDGEAVGNILVETYDLNFPAARIYSTLTNSDGSFCAQAPADTTTTVQVGGGENLCASETFNTDGFGGATCGDIGQTSECYTLGEFVCNL